MPTITNTPEFGKPKRRNTPHSKRWREIHRPERRGAFGLQRISSLCLVALYLYASALGLVAQTLPDSPLPAWPKPSPPAISDTSPTVRSQDLEVRHSTDSLGGFAVYVQGNLVAIGQNQPQIGYVTGKDLHWFAPNDDSHKTLRVNSRRNAIRLIFSATDPDSAHWQIEQTFSPAKISGAIDLRTEIKVDRDRSVAFLPVVTLFAGAGSFGSAKGQALLPGLEYLENEPSSSEADVIGPASHRQVPDSLKLTFPLMAVQDADRYVALTWQMHSNICAVFDSPDRLFGSSGHAMGLLFPGSNGKDREEGRLLPRVTQLIHANEPLVVTATIFGGAGSTVIPAVQQYVTLRGLPQIPTSPSQRNDSTRDSLPLSPSDGERVGVRGTTKYTPFDLEAYISLAAGGWLDSKIREGNLFHHAIAGGNFPTQPGADAALWMDWLASRITIVSDGAPASSLSPSDLSRRSLPAKADGERAVVRGSLANRLHQTARGVLESIPPDNLNFAAVGHVRFPSVSLAYGHVAESAERAEQTARQLLTRFEPDGSVKYKPEPGGPEFGRTHYTNEANGLTAQFVVQLLENAAFSGNRDLIAQALDKLRALDPFRNGVPRGAQTWECPLHTPDILASAHLVRAYTLGFELAGETDFLHQAFYWAWTGVPFVYLVNPASRPIGLYATIAVFGATQWRAPIWMGLPVQWCGLVYADALYRLERHDPKGPWKQIADGITWSGIQQTWPNSDHDLQGLLPDSFVLRSQKRNGPAINPATVEACATRYFGKPVYDFWPFRDSGLLVHAPGPIRHAKERAARCSFDVESWRPGQYFVLVNGLREKPILKINGKLAECSAPHQWLEKEGRLILQLDRPARVELARP